MTFALSLDIDSIKSLVNKNIKMKSKYIKIICAKVVSINNKPLNELEKLSIQLNPKFQPIKIFAYLLQSFPKIKLNDIIIRYIVSINDPFITGLAMKHKCVAGIKTLKYILTKSHDEQIALITTFHDLFSCSAKIYLISTSFKEILAQSLVKKMNIHELVSFKNGELSVVSKLINDQLSK